MRRLLHSLFFMVGFTFSLVSWAMTEEQIISALSLPENSTGNIADAIEEATGKKAIRNYLPMQTGDVPATWADASLLAGLTGGCPSTDVREGIRAFVRWYRDFYQV